MRLAPPRDARQRHVGGGRGARHEARVGEAADGAGAIEAIARLRPEVVLLDVQLPDLDGFEVAARAARNGYCPQVVLTSSRDAAEFGSLVAQSGARGFVPEGEVARTAIEGDHGAHASLQEGRRAVDEHLVEVAGGATAALAGKTPGANLVWTATKTRRPGMHQLDITTNLQELDRREGDGITVSLLWSRAEDAVSVAVYDERTTELFEFDVPRDCALDAFHHPYAYAARQGFEVVSSPREPAYA